MTNKEIFIEKINQLLNDCPDFFGQDETAEKALAYFEELKNQKSNAKAITENGLKILQYMNDNCNSCGNIFKARDIGEGIFMSGRSVSGSMRKLLSDGYVSKEGKDPVVYAITEEGKNFLLTI